MIQNLIPFITLIASVVVLKEKIDKFDFGVNASILVSLSIVTAMKLTDKNGIDVVGIVLCIINVLSFTTLNIITRYLKKPHFAILVSLQQYMNLLILVPIYLSLGSFNAIEPFTLFLLALVGIARFISTTTFIRACQ